jgi:hypothetical protein
MFVGFEVIPRLRGNENPAQADPPCRLHFNPHGSGLVYYHDLAASLSAPAEIRVQLQQQCSGG